MSTNNDPQTSADTSSDQESVGNEKKGTQVPHFVYDRKSGLMTFIAPDGTESALPTKVIESGDDEEEEGVIAPLAVEQLEDALKRLDQIGLTWSADSPPGIMPKDEESEMGFGTEEFLQIQQDYPGLPREIGIIMSYVFTGNRVLEEYIGGESQLTPKSEILKKYLLTPELRSEYFFKNAIKVPYLADIDWEVVLKLDEKGVEHWPAATYAMLSLGLREPSTQSRASHRRTIAVAVNDVAVNRFIAIFEEIRVALEGSKEIINQIPWQDERNDDEDEVKDND